MINLSKIARSNGYQEYLNPRDTFGWKKEFIITLKNTQEKYNSLAEFLDWFTGINLTDIEDLNNTQTTNLILNQTPQILYAGKKIDTLINKAFKEYSQMYDKREGLWDLMNKTAWQWEKINPQTVKIASIDDDKRNYHQKFLFWIRC